MLRAFLSQLFALLLVGVLYRTQLLQLGLLWWALLQGLAASAIAGWLKQPIWWRMIHLLFMPCVVMAWYWQLPSELYLAIFLILLLVFWGTARGDVPLFLSSSTLCDVLVAKLTQQSARRLIELGAGIGSVVVPLARALPHLQITAVERAPLPWLILRWRCRGLSNVRCVRSSFWELSFAGYDTAFAFLSPLVMSQIGAKVATEMPRGAWFISSSFAVPDWKPTWTQALNDFAQTVLFAYRIPVSKS